MNIKELIEYYISNPRCVLGAALIGLGFLILGLRV